MKLKTILLFSALTACLHSGAQTWVSDSVTMGSSYANDVYYSLPGTGAVSTIPNNTWDLAFQMTPQGPNGNVSILANSARGGDSVYSLHLQASTRFATLTAADTVGRTAPYMALFNADSSWNKGAFNRMNNAANPFDFSWGMYNITDHFVYGDSLYLVIKSGAAYKVWIQKYVSTPTDSIKWTFRVAKLDGTGDTTVQFARKNGFSDRLFGYYNLETKATTDREPSRGAWDILFTRYSEVTPYGPGVSIPYAVTGALSNFSTTVARAQHVLPAAAVMGNYTYSSTLNAIGSVWKSFNPSTNTFSIVDSNSYFIKSQNSNMYYQLQFTGFTASAGKIVFSKKTIGTTAINQLAITKLNAFAIAPNPAGNTVSIMVDAKEAAANTSIIVSDMTGKTVKIFTVNISSGMNAFTINTAGFAAGNYLVNVKAGTWNTAGKLTVQH